MRSALRPRAGWARDSEGAKIEIGDQPSNARSSVLDRLSATAPCFLRERGKPCRGVNRQNLWGQKHGARDGLGAAKFS